MHNHYSRRTGSEHWCRPNPARGRQHLLCRLDRRQTMHGRDEASSKLRASSQKAFTEEYAAWSTAPRPWQSPSEYGLWHMQSCFVPPNSEASQGLGEIHRLQSWSCSVLLAEEYALLLIQLPNFQQRLLEDLTMPKLVARPHSHLPELSSQPPTLTV